MGRPEIKSHELVVIGGTVYGNEKGYLQRCNKPDKEENRFLTDLPEARKSHCALLHNNCIFVVGGKIAGDNYAHSTLVLDLGVMKWTVGPPLNQNRSMFALVALGDSIVAIGGKDLDTGSTLSSCEKWTLGEDQWVPILSMSRRREGHCAVVYDNKIHVMGGWNMKSVECLASLETDWWNYLFVGWKKFPSLGVDRYGATAAVAINLMFVVGGEYSNTVEVYFPREKDWRFITHMPTCRGFACSGVINNQLYVVGGLNEKGCSVSTCVRFDSKTDKWILLENDIEFAVHEAAAVVIPPCAEVLDSSPNES